MAVQNTSNNAGRLANRAVKDVYPVSRLVREARVLLEGSFPLLWVEGEISNLAMPASGHIYFSLKDSGAQVRCAMFRNRNSQLRFTPENGMQVLLRVRVTLYEGRGEFQLVVEHMEEAGSGALQRAYEALKHRLGEEGLFDHAHKKSLPSFPQTIGIISSPDGAAVHDILSVLKRRFPAINVILYPVAVQGESSASQLTTAVRKAEQRNECDVLIISRGGGSLEDLWSFNDEKLARAVYECQLPIISAVGHEVDFTIADFVADVRAATPSAAAELAVPDANQLSNNLMSMMQRLTKTVTQLLSAEQRHIHTLQQRLPRPEQYLRQQTQSLSQQKRRLMLAWQRIWDRRQQHVDYLTIRLKHPQAQIDKQRTSVLGLSHRLNSAFLSQQKTRIQQFTFLHSRVHQQRPLPLINEQQRYINALSKQSQRLIELKVQNNKQLLSQHVRTLAAVSPLNTLDRGYSITSHKNMIITNAEQVKAGSELDIRLHQGHLVCEVKHSYEK